MIQVKEPIVLVMNEEEAEALMHVVGNHSIDSLMRSTNLSEATAKTASDIYPTLHDLLIQRGVIK